MEYYSGISDDEALRMELSIPPPLNEERCRWAAFLPDGLDEVTLTCTAAFRHLNARHYIALDSDPLAAQLASDKGHLDHVRDQKLKLRKDGQRHLLDEQNVAVLPWTWPTRLSSWLLRLVGTASVFVVWNTVSSLIISSGVVDRFVEFPLLAFAYAFGTFAIAVAVDGAVSTFTGWLRQVIFAVVLVGAILAFGCWLREVSGLVSTGNISFEQLKDLILHPRDATLSGRLLVTQVATEMLSGLLAWMVAGKIRDNHRIVGPTANGLYEILEAEERTLDEKVRIASRHMKEIDVKRQKLADAEQEYVTSEVKHVKALRAEAEVRARRHEAATEASAWLLGGALNGNGKSNTPPFTSRQN